MRLLLKLVYRTMSRLLRRFGLGLLLVPVAALGVLLFGVHPWTVLAALVAVVLAIWWPSVAATLLPVMMVAVGISGLVLAATAASPEVSWVSRAFSVWQVAPAKGFPAKLAQIQAETIAQSPAGIAMFGGWAVLPSSLSVPRQVFLPGARLSQGGSGKVVTSTVVRRVVVTRGGKRVVITRGVKASRIPAGKALAATKFVHPPYSAGLGVLRSGVRPVAQYFVPDATLPRFTSGPAGSPWPGRLVPVALLLIALGLWLAPRTFVQLRSRAPGVLPFLRRRMLETRWGILLVPAALVGLSVFGVHMWTLAMILAAAVITLQWPLVAADLVPAVLAAFAVRGFALTAHWESSPVVLDGQAQLYGAVLVSSRQLAVLAGAEASAFLAMAAWLVPRTVVAHARMLVAPGPDAELAGRVQRLTETRGHALDAATSELRRIERDLHDGAQARLVALGMNLRAVERMLPASPEAALALVAEARETSVRALNDLRDLIRGICPPVLADRGLGHAVRALALDTPLPIELDLDLPGRFTAPVESACYFAVAEVLANAVKHSGARRVHLRIQHTGGLLRIEVADDGVGGADPANGTGLEGIERRLGTFDGILAVNSPPGGPTMIVMEVPCALSSPKTCSC